MLSYNEVRERVNLPDDDIMRLLHSLSCAKYRILNKMPVSKTISKTDTFSFNNRFTDKMRRIKVWGHSCTRAHCQVQSCMHGLACQCEGLWADVAAVAAVPAVTAVPDAVRVL